MSPEQISSAYDNWIIVRRWAATWVDFLVLGGLFAGLLALQRSAPAIAVVSWLVLLCLYYPLLEGLAGWTPGKLLCSLRVVDKEGRKPGLDKALVRTLLRLIEINPLFMGGLPAGIAAMVSKTRQRIGDSMAGTYVLRAEDMPCLGGSPAALQEFSLGRQEQVPFGPVRTAYAVRDQILAPTRTTWAVPPALVATVASAALIGFGVVEMKAHERANPPTRMTCEEFLASPAREGYYVLTGCRIDASDAVYETLQHQSEYGDPEDGENATTVGEIFIPVRTAGGNPTPLVVRTSDEKIRNLVEEMHALEEDSDEVLAWLEEHEDELVVRKDVKGTVYGSAEIPETVRGPLEEGELASDYSVLREGDEPVPFAAVGLFVGGGIIVVLTAMLWVVALVGLGSGGGTGRRV